MSEASIHPTTLRHLLGYFATTGAAHAAYVEAKRKYHEGNTL